MGMITMFSEVIDWFQTYLSCFTRGRSLRKGRGQQHGRYGHNRQRHEIRLGRSSASGQLLLGGLLLLGQDREGLAHHLISHTINKKKKYHDPIQAKGFKEKRDFKKGGEL